MSKPYRHIQIRTDQTDGRQYLTAPTVMNRTGIRCYLSNINRIELTSLHVGQFSQFRVFMGCQISEVHEAVWDELRRWDLEGRPVGI